MREEGRVTGRALIVFPREGSDTVALQKGMGEGIPKVMFPGVRGDTLPMGRRMIARETAGVQSGVRGE